MYEVSFDVVKNGDPDGFAPYALVCADLERAIALSSLLLKMSCSEVSYNYIQINPLTKHDYEKKN